MSERTLERAIERWADPFLKFVGKAGIEYNPTVLPFQALASGDPVRFSEDWARGTQRAGVEMVDRYRSVDASNMMHPSFSRERAEPGYGGAQGGDRGLMSNAGRSDSGHGTPSSYSGTFDGYRAWLSEGKRLGYTKKFYKFVKYGPSKKK